MIPNTAKLGQEGRLALIDGDVLCYRVLWRLSDGSPHDHIDVEDEILLELEKWMRGLGAGPWIPVICTSADPTFRHLIYPEYKANRKDTRKPIFLDHGKWFIRNMRYAERAARPLECSLMEADDVMGILATTPEYAYDCVVVTVDKDLDQIPGDHYNPVKDIHYTVSFDDSKRMRYKQWLMGDTTDNIPGLPGIGPKRADKLIEEYEVLEFGDDAIEQIYEDRDFSREYCRTMGALTTILQYGPRSGPEMWHATHACSLRSVL